MFHLKSLIGTVIFVVLLSAPVITGWADTKVPETLSGQQTLVPIARGTKFYDTEAHWAENAISYVVEKNLFTGTDPYIFSPEEEMTRGMFITVLSRISNESTAGYQNPFSDVSEDTYYRDAAAWASEKGLVSSGGIFQPDTGISRQEMAVLMDRMMNYKDKRPSSYTYGTEGTLELCDAADIAAYAKSAVQNMQGMNIITGKPGVKDGTAVRYFDPNKTASRAEVAVIIQRFMMITGEE